ncbi:centrosomal protein 43-like [Uloborus diversus]|uniref:centrosomal protein 43-like n=1 Tax=Uloborus diversus TaxID=327109 RepID=UPI0024092EFE|nr:centrosomal protein 43-like [Uloborus diversus]
MLAEEETELRDLIIQNLEKCGFLNKIKAELRAGVCLALEEETDFKTKIPLLNAKLNDFVDTPEGKLVVSIIREFLEYFGLNFTLSVFDPEVSCKTPFLSRSQLCDRLKLSITDKESVISSLLKPSHTGNRRDFPDTSVRDTDLMRSKSTDISSSRRYISENVSGGEEGFPNSMQKELTVSNDVKNQFVKNKASEGGIGLNNEKAKQEETLFRGDKTRENEPFSKVDSSKFQKPDFKMDNIFSKEKSDSPLDEIKDISDITHDSFFDEPLPAAKPAYFNYAEDIIGTNFKGNSKTNIFKDKNNQYGIDNNSLTSLKDLPSLTTKEWSFSKDPKNMHPSLDSLKSVSSSENSNEEIINLDDDLNNKKDADITESNEDTSEKQLNSEESIEEDIDEDASTGLDDLLNSSLSLADDATTDQTVSQISIVHGVDHVEPCNSLS